MKENEKKFMRKKYHKRTGCKKTIDFTFKYLKIKAKRKTRCRKKDPQSVSAGEEPIRIELTDTYTSIKKNET